MLNSTGAFLLGAKGKVILLAKHEDIAQKTDVGIRDDLKSVLSRLFVDIHYCTRLVGVTEVGAVVQHQNDEPVEIPCDSVVIAAGTRSRTLLAQQVADLGVDVVVVGDAVKPRQITQASAEGFRAGLFA